MFKLLLRVCTSAVALGFIATVSHALTVPSQPLNAIGFVAIPVADQEEEAVEQFLEPDEYAPGSQDEAGPVSAAPQGTPKAEGSDDTEQNAVKQEFPSLDLPPDRKQ
jgi:hypothetical protein